MLKSVVKRAVRRLGFDLNRYLPTTSARAQLMAMLSAHGVNLVFDVGANIGQFGRLLREVGYRGRIVSFEPLSFEHEQLLKISRKDALWEVAPRAAIGSEDGEIEIHVAGNSSSSSILDILAEHAMAAPESRYIGKERVALRRLDSIAADFLRPDSVLFLKIDTQGYEDRILRGATEFLGKVNGIQLELSLVPLYEGQLLYDEIVDKLITNGFELWAMWTCFADPRSGRLLQVDATFFRR